MNKILLSVTALLGAATVMIGAFGAHALKPLLEANGKLASFETAVKYQFYHVLAMMLVLILAKLYVNVNFNWVILFFFIGVLLFSGSIYILSLTTQKWAGPITPIGGLFLIAGWVWLAWKVYKA